MNRVLLERRRRGVEDAFDTFRARSEGLEDAFGRAAAGRGVPGRTSSPTAARTDAHNDPYHRALYCNLRSRRTSVITSPTTITVQRAGFRPIRRANRAPP
jgi:hypothetical protein